MHSVGKNSNGSSVDTWYMLDRMQIHVITNVTNSLHVVIMLSKTELSLGGDGVIIKRCLNPSKELLNIHT